MPGSGIPELKNRVTDYDDKTELSQIVTSKQIFRNSGFFMKIVTELFLKKK